MIDTFCINIFHGTKASTATTAITSILADDTIPM